MKLTKKLEAEIRKVYATFWDSYINGDLKTYASFLDADFKFIGSTEAEPLLNKKDSIKFLEATAEQLRGKAEFRNRNIKVETADDLILITELCDGYILIGSEWKFYSRFRLSSLLKKKKGDWMFIHQHVSMPDSKAQEGESYGLEQIRTENIQLRDAVKRRTVELENKNRELGIEAALERVRAVAMSMHKPEDLPGVGETIFTELKSLGFTELRNTEIIIISDEKETLTSYYYSDYGVTGLVEVDYKSNPKVQSWVDQLKKANDAFAEVVITEKEIKAWRKYREEVGHVPDPKLDKAKAVYYYSYSIGMGGLSISTFKPTSTEQIEILERFRNVFNLSYQRYIDIAKAEAQAREAKIEVGLERARTQSMLMQKSNELNDTLQVFHQQLQLLGINSDFSYLWLPDEENDKHVFWATWEEEKNNSTILKSKTLAYPLDRDESYTAQCLADWKSGIPVHTYKLPPAEVENYFVAWQELLSGAEKLKAEFFPAGFDYVEAFMKYGCFGIVVSRLLTEDEKQILRRFTIEFERAYTRFLDLQKAEAQAREAQIEAGLERVRSRSLAMHNTSELQEVIHTVHKELLNLNITIHGGSFIAINRDVDTVLRCWGSGGTANTSEEVRLPPYEKPFCTNLINRIKNGPGFFTEEYTQKEKKDFFTFLFKHQPWSKLDAKKKKETLSSPGGYTRSCCVSRHTSIFIINHFGEKFSAADNDVLQRFGKVFEQAYTRFLDLQNAEAQAREAQIETALERVRSRTMGMQKSEELKAVIQVVYEQFIHLNIKIEHTGFVIDYKARDDYNIWIADPLGVPSQVIVPYFDSVYYNRFNEAKEKGEDFFATNLSFEEKNKFYQKLFEYVPGLPEQAKEFYFSCPGLAASTVLLENVCLYIENFSGIPYSDEENKTLMRFGKVFQQTYTRFLDLQKAEAQARESQIEAALEKIRSRSLAMHQPAELKKVIAVMFQKLDELHVVHGTVAIQLFDFKTKNSFIIPKNTLQEEPPVASLPFDEKMMEEGTCHRDLWNAMEKGQIIFNKVYTKKQKDRWFEYVFANNDLKTIEANAREFILQAKTYTVCFIPEKNSALLVDSFDGSQYSGEDLKVLKRVARVFEQAYTRFLDLQTAEAQAREAQIEASLERVRASAMAMHHSDELSDVLTVLFEQFDVLNIRPVDVHLDLFDFEKNTFSYRATGKEGKRVIAEQIVEIDSRPEWQSLLERWKKGKPNTVGFSYYPKEVIPVLMTFFPDIWAAMPPDAIMNPEDFPDGIFDTLGYCKFGYIGFHHYRNATEEEKNILIRFANEFERLYQRFLDLQKAEAQSRESQIQLALERVRARTMAMQKSDELMETAVVLFDQLKQLGENIERTIIGVMNEEERVVDVWATRPDGSQMEKMQKFPIDEPVVMQKVYEAWQQQKKSIVIDLRGEELENYFQFMKGRSSKLKRESFGERRVENFTFFSKGFLGVINADPNTPANVELYERFAAVFEQTYTRFLDLQKAEAQARESQIELGLERVRARAMAMQKSDELSELVDTVFKELTKLDFALTWCIINIIDESSLSNTVWAANPDINKAPESYHMLFEDYPFHHAMMKGWKERKTKYVYVLEGSEKKVYDDYLFSETEFKRTPQAAQAASRAMEKYVVSFTFSNFGGLQTVGDVPLSDANLDILSRFGKVFDLTYTRFNDLKQAEAQARESQIQLALERVRARTMAMQKSDELAEAASLLFTQIADLGTNSWSSGFIIFQPDELSINSWMSKPDGSMGVPFNIPVTEDPFFIKIYEAYKRGEEFFVMESGGKELEETYRYMFGLPGAAKALGAIEDIGFQMPTFQITHCTFFPQGLLMFITYEPCPEMWDIFKRFGKVFEQTYTRFLDLQKAEAQAKESQIQLALERVRARTMAMQHSDELKDAAALLFQQAKALGVPAYSCGYNIWKKNDKTFTSWMSTQDGSDFNGVPDIPLTEDANFIRYVESKQKGEQFFVLELRGERMQEHYEYLKTIPAFKAYFDYAISVGFDLPQTQIHYLANFSQGNLLFISLEPCPEFHDVFKRFAAVFEQTYTRFLDLQKAEAQTREAKIEAALEKVRARTMAMQKSDELPETSYLLFQQVKELGLTAVQNSIAIINEETGFVELSTTVHGHHLPHTLNVPINDPYVMAKAFTAWKAKHESLKVEIRGQELKDYNEHRNSFFETKVDFPEDQWIVNIIFFSKGWLSFSSNKNISGETFELLKRFSAVFEQTYIRFNDLKQAEAQAREAQIQLAMERVRARTMAMQRSDELPEAANLLFLQVQSLGMPAWSAGYCIWDDDKKAITLSMSSEGVLQPSIRMPLTEDPSLLHFLEAHQRGESFFVEEVGGEALKSHYVYLRTLPGVKETLDDIEKAGFPVPTFQIFHCAYFSKGFLLFITYEPVPEAHDIFKRFAKVFEQTYIRFLDLQKAEAQIREAKIEAALEKVRSRTMAMQRSAELAEVATVLFQQVKALGVPQWTCGFSIFEIDDKEFTWYPGSADGEILSPNKIPLTEHPVFISFNESRKRGDELFVYEKEGEFQAGHYRYMRSLPGGEEMYQNTLKAGLTFPAFQIDHIANFSHGNLVFITYEHFPEMHDVFKRFAKVFDQTYTRFLDLQKSEAQVREAKIETALERVRSNTMAMHHSEELKEVISVTFEQLKSLNIIIDSCIINLFIEGSDDLNVWVASAEQKYPQKVRIPYLKHPVFDKTAPSKNKSGNSFTIKLSQKENQAFYKHIIENSDFGKIINEDRRKLVMNADNNFMSFANFKHTGLRVGNFRDHAYTQEENNTILRFANVFEQTYTRFLDLQKAEAQAREAIKQASVDRIRAEIASMRTTNDLERIQPIIWNELTTLGVPFTRCGVFIMDEEHEQVDTFLSTPDGRSIASFTSNYSDVAVISEALPYWRRKEIYKAHWDEATFLAQAKTLLEQGNITSTETYLTEHRPKDLYLHFLPFLQGILYVGNETPLNDDELQLVQNLADAFSIAYARYEDFNKLELAKGQIEKTLVDLKQTQAQLVQSEKMASLGELTAGIAHEIQNPLNFVNNFSDVNKELLVEMKDEIEKGNIEEVKAIANDIIGNEEKISHHGKRADAIVKGMLQHSRSSSGVKEAADINVLADEYLRLAYHGLRAKDKFFNATMKTEYDESIGKIDIVPQDIGRSVLNLITNAFYAVAEKKKQNAEGYEPTVTVTTKRINGKIEIRVADNGNGIPQKVLDKIFQPFFTTKPTGQGTGLGLSLSYDIIKAHGGEINVETKEGQGSEFFIFLPANN